MSKKKSGAKALALAVGFAVLAGGYGLNPVYAEDMTSITFTGGTVSFSSSTLYNTGTITGGSATVKNSDIVAAINEQSVTKMTIGGITIDDGALTRTDGVTVNGVKFASNGVVTGVTSIDGVAVASSDGVNGGLKIGDNATIGATGTPFSSTGFSVDSDGDVQGKSFTTANNITKLADKSLTIDNDNTWTENGITASKAAINGVTIGEASGKATFAQLGGGTTTIEGSTITVGTGDTTTTITDKAITTDTLNVNKIVLGDSIVNKDGVDINNGGKLTISADGSLKAAGGNFTVGIDGAVVNTVQDPMSNATTRFETTTTGAAASFAKDNVTSSVSVADKSASLTVANTADGTTTTNGVTVTDKAASLKVGDNGVAVDSISQSASMSYGNGSVTVKDESVTTKVGNDITNTTVTTTESSFSVKGADGKGMTIDTTTGATTFTGNSETHGGGSQTTTVINGNEITTGKITTDQLVIKGNGSGDATGDASGSIALAGDGSIKSNIKVDDKETTFETNVNGTHTSVKDGENKVTTFETTADGTKTQVKIDGGADSETDITTTNEIRGNGAYTEVKIADDNYSAVQQNVEKTETTIKNGDNHSTSTQTATSIGGVVTSGTVSVSQKLDAQTGTITNIVTDGEKTSQVVQNKDGLEISNGAAGTTNVTKITDTDVSITDQKNNDENGTPKRISLSQLGQLDNLDSELKGRDEYTKGADTGTAVGAINAEAQVRREEVARLDNRIDDVNDRLDKVGAMSAAIASLKSMGYDPQAPSEFSVGLGQYKGETGVALGFFHYPNKNFMINVSLSTAGGETMGGVGATWRFGHKSPQKLLDEQRAAQAKKEQAAAEKYRVAAELAKEAQERAEYAAKLARQAQVSADNAKAAADATQAKIN